MHARRLAPFLLTPLLVGSCSLPLPLMGDHAPDGHAWGYWRKAQLSNLHLSLSAPAEGWDTAKVTLVHPDPLTPASVLSLVKDEDIKPDDTGTYRLSNLFERLPAADGYTLVVSLWRGGVGSMLVGEASVPVSLRLGTTTARVSISQVSTLRLSGFDPGTGAPGSLVILTGQGFSLMQDQNVVSLGGVAAQVVDASSDTLRVVVPSVPPGSYAWRVQVGSLLTGRAGFIVP